MLSAAPQAARAKPRNLLVDIASSPCDILEAQKLRYRVFAEEMGARLPNNADGIDRDHFDPYCKHLIVRDDDCGRVVGTYRILTPENARRIGGYYSETEFDLTRLQHLRPGLVEVGRSCIDADYRTGAVITLLWSGLARFMTEGGYNHLMGCASISMADGGHNAANVYGVLQSHLSSPEYRVFARNPLPVERLATPTPVEVPPLLKGYMRAGAAVCGAPAWDPDFNTADLLLLLSMSKVDTRYARHFVERQAA
ncbi:MAG: GNAT family N-acyltransferase [Rhodocyclaceae bacterium]